MTQPTQEGAVGDANAIVDAAELPIEDRFAAITDEESGEGPQVKEVEAPEGEIPKGDEAELQAEDVTDDEAEDLPPIAAPVSWTADNRQKFAELPRDLQEYVAARESDRERFVQAKAQEAAQTRAHVEREALSHLAQLQSAAAEQLAHYAAHFDVPEPDPRLITEDPESYAHQLEQHRYYAAQREQAQLQAEHAHGEAQRAEQALRSREAEEFCAILNQHFPEFLEPSNAKLREELGSIARELGYPAEQLAEANANDVLAMKKASDWRAKAQKYDTLMAKKMEKVREAGKLPKVSRPGVAQGRGAAEGARYAADRQAMKSGDRDAAIRTFSRFI